MAMKMVPVGWGENVIYCIEEKPLVVAIRMTVIEGAMLMHIPLLPE